MGGADLSRRRPVGGCWSTAFSAELDVRLREHEVGAMARLAWQDKQKHSEDGARTSLACPLGQRMVAISAAGPLSPRQAEGLEDVRGRKARAGAVGVALNVGVVAYAGMWVDR